MLTVLGKPRHFCEGPTRREVLRAGALSLFGSVAGAGAAGPGRAFWTSGRQGALGAAAGPVRRPQPSGHVRPEAVGPARNPRRVPAHQYVAARPADLRILAATGPLDAPDLPDPHHLARLQQPQPYAVMTGYTGGNDREDYFAKPSNHPGMGAVCQYLGVGRRHDLPGYVILPAFPGYSQGLRRAGPYGGLPRWPVRPSILGLCGTRRQRHRQRQGLLQPQDRAERRAQAPAPAERCHPGRPGPPPDAAGPGGRPGPATGLRQHAPDDQPPAAGI